MNSAKISYSPDYRSEKRKAGRLRNTGGSAARKWHGPIGCLFCDYTTKQHHDAGASFDEQQDIISEHLDTHGRWHYHSSEQEERERLEREVIERVKTHRRVVQEFKENTNMENWNRCFPAREAAEAAIDALLAFESEQEGNA